MTQNKSRYPSPKHWETEFLKLAAVHLACRLTMMGGTPVRHPQHVPVTDFRTLEWALLGMSDYADEMRLLCRERMNTR